VSHGALITYQGDVLPAWQSRLTSQLEGARQAIALAYADLVEALPRHYPHLQFTLRQLEDLSVPVYLSIKAVEELPVKVHELLSSIAHIHGLTLHANTRNAALRPSFTCKAQACSFLMDEVIMRQPEDTVVALGDSLSDLSFMAQSDMAIIPTRSQAWNALKELSQ
jgi:hydroxymethylpyrimidine pyrophosphatase-like HAD family hydrolase